MNPIMESLLARKSMRVFTGEPIPAEAKKAILTAAMAAPSAGNQQLYTILDITNQSLKDKLAITCDDQPFIAKADMVLVFCADCQKWYDAFAAAGCEPRRPGVGDLMLAASDTCIAAQNAVIAAESLGIGSCYIGDILERCEVHRSLLQLPEYVMPVAMLVFGYPTQQQKERQQLGRCQLRHIVHENSYRRMDAAELEEMLCWKAGEQDYKEWMQRFCDRKYNTDFSLEMTRSVEAYLAAFPHRNEKR